MGRSGGKAIMTDLKATLDSYTKDVEPKLKS
ncbi:hypothetical protein HNP00_003304 [Arthrobacter sp. AZCC_0090]|nr:hypothetical protein [Arthrobacter sp. AZCC_0090]